MKNSLNLALPSLVLALIALPAAAHHGVAGVGAAGLEGPGAPLEAAASSVLPEGKTLAYFKIDDAQFKTYDWASPNAKYSRFWMAGVGYGFTPWFSAYVFAPYNEKVDQAGGFTTRGWADVSLMGQIGFKYDKGFQLTPANESLDDLDDWHFSLMGGASLPTGQPNLRDRNGDIDPGKSTGFGKPSFTIGLTASKTLTPKLTFNLEASTIRFQDSRYADGNRLRFGTENRVNTALAYRAYTNAEARFRLDPVLELQYLDIARDRSNGVGELASGGRILYGLLGVRAYWQNMSFAAGLKKPVWTRLNESSQQQGSEGKEKYRFIFSASVMF